VTEHDLISLVGVIVLGVAAQWLAWRLGLPSILLLLVIGILAGPVTQFLRPDALLGEALVPIVSLSVAVILFEGGLSLKVRELLAVGKAVRNLVTVGAAITWGMTTLSGRYILNLSWPIALLFAAILVMTGPTVIGPLLRSVRPATPVGTFFGGRVSL
jgi:NhaP-type Na+/H+ or K+/H+ antiporter